MLYVFGMPSISNPSTTSISYWILFNLSAFSDAWNWKSFMLKVMHLVKPNFGLRQRVLNINFATSRRTPIVRAVSGQRCNKCLVVARRLIDA